VKCLEKNPQDKGKTLDIMGGKKNGPRVVKKAQTAPVLLPTNSERNPPVTGGTLDQPTRMINSITRRTRRELKGGLRGAGPKGFFSTAAGEGGTVCDKPREGRDRGHLPRTARGTAGVVPSGLYLWEGG